jgi:hypothetical protein
LGSFPHSFNAKDNKDDEDDEDDEDDDDDDEDDARGSQLMPCLGSILRPGRVADKKTGPTLPHLPYKKELFFK